MTHRPWRRTRRLLGLIGGVALVALLADQRWPLPPPPGGAIVEVQDAQGRLLRAWPDRQEVWRLPVTLDAVDPVYVDTLLSFEDRWFRWHPGVNPVALARAGWQWLRHGRIVSGGSTITMQVARLIDPDLAEDSRHPLTKVRQIARALQLEWHWSKDEILSTYLEYAPMGGAVAGVAMGSQQWLGKPPQQLSVAEAALLVALPQAPSRLRPDRAPAAARAARDKVLHRLAAFGKLDDADLQDALAENILPPPAPKPWLAPLAAERLRAAHPGQSRIVSTLDADLQADVQALLAARVPALGEGMSAAILVMHNDTLALHAYAGAARYGDPARHGFLDMARAVRSPGSTLKPFLYGAALDDGLIHAESLLVDAPHSFGGYRPGNFQASFSGPVSVAEALARSLNVPAVTLLAHYGPGRFAALLHRGGIPLQWPAGAEPNLSLVLGGAGTQLEALVGAYRALARDGVAGQPRLTADEPMVLRPLLSPGAAFITRRILEDGGHPDQPRGRAPRAVAWKTGTSFGFRDAWALGVTPTWTIGVWVGRPDGTPSPGQAGAKTAVPLLLAVVDRLADPARFSGPPASVSADDICWPQGLRRSATFPADCQRVRRAWLLDDTAPPTLPEPGGVAQSSRWWLDPNTGLRTRPGCTAEAQPMDTARWPARALPWLARLGLPGDPVPAWTPGCAEADGAPLRLEGILPEALLVPTQAGASLSLPVHVIGAEAPVWWLLDGQPLAQTSDGRYRLQLRPSQARQHQLTAVDATGRHAGVRFQVLPR